MESDYFYAIVNLLILLSVLLGLFFLLKKFKFAKLSRQKLINVVQVVPIGSKEKIVLIQLKGTHILLGATANHIEKLHVFDGSPSFDAVAAEAMQCFSSADN